MGNTWTQIGNDIEKFLAKNPLKMQKNQRRMINRQDWARYNAKLLVQKVAYIRNILSYFNR